MQYSLAYIALFPLLGSLAAYIVGKKIERKAAGWIATAACVASFIVVVRAFFALPESVALEQNLFHWFKADALTVDFSFRFDQLTAVMCLVITGIGSLIHLYSIGYMAEDASSPRFFAYLNLFLFSMLLLVLGGNLLVLFVGWEGVGLCSYLLIGFWFKNLEYASAGKKAFVVNRIGDAGFLLAIFLLFKFFGTVDFIALASAISNHANIATVPLVLIALCLFVGATGKSAQIPLFVWLPDAMAGPTPVSALIHAATMVTAGVYMLARMHFLFDLAPQAMAVVTVVALLTAFVAATTAMAQYDIKKVLAYSTVSQLGFMFLAASTGAYWVAIFHVVTHAFFKACLFLGAGSVIHACHHEQDMRQMGGLRKHMPFTFWTYLISTVAIAGIFPFAGYQSKHAILAALADNQNQFLPLANNIIVGIVTVTAGLTAFYMMRSVVMTFFGEYRGHAKPHESPWFMTVPLVILAFFASVVGVFLHERLPEFLSPVVPVPVMPHHESIFASLLHSWVGILGVVIAVLLYTRWTEIPGVVLRTSGFVGKVFQRKYYFDELYHALIVFPLQCFARLLWKDVDQVLIDGVVNGSAAVVDVSGKISQTSQSGRLSGYALYMFLGTVLLLVFCFIL